MINYKAFSLFSLTFVFVFAFFPRFCLAEQKKQIPLLSLEEGEISEAFSRKVQESALLEAIRSHLIFSQRASGEFLYFFSGRVLLSFSSELARWFSGYCDKKRNLLLKEKDKVIDPEQAITHKEEYFAELLRSVAKAYVSRSLLEQTFEQGKKDKRIHRGRFAFNTLYEKLSDEGERIFADSLTLTCLKFLSVGNEPIKSPTLLADIFQNFEISVREVQKRYHLGDAYNEQIQQVMELFLSSAVLNRPYTVRQKAFVAAAVVMFSGLAYYGTFKVPFDMDHIRYERDSSCKSVQAVLAPICNQPLYFHIVEMSRNTYNKILDTITAPVFGKVEEAFNNMLDSFEKARAERLIKALKTTCLEQLKDPETKQELVKLLEPLRQELIKSFTTVLKDAGIREHSRTLVTSLFGKDFTDMLLYTLKGSIEETGIIDQVTRPINSVISMQKEIITKAIKWCMENDHLKQNSLQIMQSHFYRGEDNNLVPSEEAEKEWIEWINKNAPLLQKDIHLPTLHGLSNKQNVICVKNMTVALEEAEKFIKELMEKKKALCTELTDIKGKIALEQDRIEKEIKEKIAPDQAGSDKKREEALEQAKNSNSEFAKFLTERERIEEKIEKLEKKKQKSLLHKEQVRQALSFCLYTRSLKQTISLVKGILAPVNQMRKDIKFTGSALGGLAGTCSLNLNPPGHENPPEPEVGADYEEQYFWD